MRIGSVSLLVLAAFALAACAGAETGGGTLAASSINGLDIAPCTLETCPPNSDSDTDPITDNNNDGIDDNADGNDGSNEGGNTTNLSPTTSDVTIGLEKSILVRPTSGTALSLLTAPASGSLTTTQQILGATKPTQLMIRVDTNSSTNGDWPTPILMTEHVPGTTAVDWTGNNNGGTNCAPDCGYREYRAVSPTPGAERNEVLQLWAWNESYATQYRNATSGDAPQQAWSFGGNRTAAMPTVGTVGYTGRFVATAKTENWLKPDGSDVDPNALWRVQGASAISANFGTASVTGTLSPQTWESYQAGVATGDLRWVVGTPGTVAQPNFSFYNSNVTISGTITGNTYAGAASLTGGFVNTINDPANNPMYGGFFGTGAAETTGVFEVFGLDPSPIGGSAGINDDRAGYVTMSGAFHAD